MQYSSTPGTQGICPSGWHIPTDNEWKTLEMHLGMTQDQANETDYRGTDQGSQLAGDEPLWIDGPLDQNGVFEASGFKARPGGLRNDLGFFSIQSVTSEIWSSSEDINGWAWHRRINFNHPDISRTIENKNNSFSVRCVMD